MVGKASCNGNRRERGIHWDLVGAGNAQVHGGPFPDKCKTWVGSPRIILSFGGGGAGFCFVGIIQRFARHQRAGPGCGGLRSGKTDGRS